MNPLSPRTPPAFFSIISTSEPFSFAMSCWLPVTGSETNVMRPCRFVTISEPCPVVLYFPAHSLPSPSQDQHGHSVPSTRAIASLVASAASSVVGRSPSVAFSTNGVRNVMYRDIVAWSTSKMSAHTSSIMCCRRYPQVTTSASRKVSSRGRLILLSQGSPSSSSARDTSSSSCSSSSPDIRSNRNGFSVVERFGGLCKTLLEEVEPNCGAERGPESLQRPAVVREENSPGLQGGDGSLDWRTKGTYLVVPLLFPLQKLTAFQLADRSGDIIRPDESLVAKNPARLLQYHLHVRALQLRHVMLVASDRLGGECYAALQIRYDQRAVSRGLVFPGPQLTFAVPGPARPQRAVYEGDRVPGSLGCVLRRRPVPVCRLLDQWREKRDVPRYRRLVNLEDVGPYLFDYVLPQISAGDDKCLPQGQLAWASYSFIPGFPEQFVRAVHQFVELLFVQS